MMFYKILHGQVDVDLPDYVLGSIYNEGLPEEVI